MSAPFAGLREGDRAPADLSSALSLSDFCGQKLVVIFCPSSSDAAAAEIESYSTRADAFQQAGVWLVAVTRSADEALTAGSKSRIALLVDPDGLAFQTLAARFPDEATDAASAIAFLVDRDGVARHVWPGAGRVEDVLAGVRERP